MLKYHGGVWGDRNGYSDHADIIGRNFCVSFAYPELAGFFHEIGQSVLLDNGAFTFYKQGKTTDWSGFYKWADKWLEFPSTLAIIPDVMGGGEDDNDKLLAQWPHGQRGTPVWHPDESMERLERLRDEWDLVCIGGAASYEPVNGPKWKARIADAMDILCDEEGLPRCKIHMLRGLRFVAGPYPLYSADSVSVVRGRGGMPSSGVPPKSIRKMLDRIDGRNPPERWDRGKAITFEVGIETTVEVEVGFDADALERAQRNLDAAIVTLNDFTEASAKGKLAQLRAVRDAIQVRMERRAGGALTQEAVELDFPPARMDEVVEKSEGYAKKPRKVRGDKEGDNLPLF